MIQVFDTQMKKIEKNYQFLTKIYHTVLGFFLDFDLREGFFFLIA